MNTDFMFKLLRNLFSSKLSCLLGNPKAVKHYITIEKYLWETKQIKNIFRIPKEML